MFVLINCIDSHSQALQASGGMLEACTCEDSAKLKYVAASPFMLSTDN